jgi:hypothetical protein
MERQVLEVLLARHVPVVVCIGKRLGSRSVSSAWRPALEEKRLLVISPFTDRQKRVTRGLAYQRNRIVSAMSKEVLVPFASTGGRTERVVREALTWKKTLWSFGLNEEDEMFALGVRETDARTLAAHLGSGPGK